MNTPRSGKAAPGPKPVAPEPIKARIPDELRSRPQWVVWRYELDKDRKKWTKVLYRASNPKANAKHNDSSTWSSFETAWKAYGRGKDSKGPARLDGIGYVFSPDDPFTGADLDNCLDERGKVLRWARPYFDRLSGTYGEISPSGRGVKFVGMGKLPDTGHRKPGLGPDKTGAVELYDCTRFFTITGNLHPEAADELADVQAAVDAIHAELWPPRAKSKATAPRPVQATPLPDDEDLLLKAKAAQNGAKFSALFDGDISGYGSHSEADLALCDKLGWWWGLDAEAVDRMFRRSGLYRDKWDEDRGGQTYGAMTIAKALEGKTDCYDPPSRRNGKAKGEPSANASKAAGPPPEAPADPPDEEEPERPAVEITTQRDDVAKESIKALARDPELYSRGDMLVIVVREDRDSVSLTKKTTLEGLAGAPKIIGLSDSNVGCVLTRNVDFFQWRENRKGEPITVPAQPPDWLIKAVATRKHWPGVRRLVSVVECPYPKADGSIVETPGYDPETGTLYIPGMTFPPIPENPTRGDAAGAWGRIRDVIREFPFGSEDDRAVFLAGLLNVIARTAIAGPVPGVAVVGNKAGCGKGLLIEVIGLIAHGRIVPTSTYPGDKEEAAKVKLSIARGGYSLIHFDNVEEGTSYGNSALDSSITSMVVNDRVLGTSEHTGDLKLRPAWFLSGNNVSPGKDAHRRWLPCNLFTELERPEERRDIEVKDLRSHIAGRRGDLVRDALTILKAHARAGRPVGDWAPLGSFEEWDSVVRGAVWFATGRDCCFTRRKAADDSPARRAKVALLHGWCELPEGMKLGITAAKAVELADKEPEMYATLRNALMHFGRDGKLATARAVGTVLRGMKGNITEGMKFNEVGLEHQAILWAVAKSDPNHPKSQKNGECGELGECYPADLAGGFDPHNYMSAHAHEVKTCLASAEKHSPDSPHSPTAARTDPAHSDVDWDSDLGTMIVP